MFKFATSILLFSFFLLPGSSFAHPKHPAGAPEHPVDSPEYHTVESDTQPSKVEAISTVSSEQSVYLATLVQLLNLLKAQFEFQFGFAPDIEVTPDPTSDEMVACTADAFQCSDGSWVGRTGSSCEFVCPGASEIQALGSLTITTDEQYRYFSSDGLPEYHISGNRYANTASAQDHNFRVPLNPNQNETPTYYNIPFSFGIALNGVTFEPFAAEWYQNDRNSGWQEDPFVTLPDLDAYNAHVQPNGLYHYHGQPTNLMGDGADSHSSLIGYASDGFPIYGPHVYVEATDTTSGVYEIDSNYQLKSGTRPSGPGGVYDGTYNEDYEHIVGGANDLDECNGRSGVTPEYTDGIYYYVVTESFPYIPRCLMGDQDPSFAAGPGPR